ncbi:MAG: antibiotic resistance protein VanZ [Myxococcales bacterium]|nr:antibiotic resistance protein VanZ [Myxococcales bacterium]
MPARTRSRGKRLRLGALVAFGVALVAVIALSLAPARYTPAMDEGNRAGHLVAYGVLALLGGSAATGRRMPWLIPLALVLLGAVLELAQGLVASRVADPGDAVANALGVTVGSLVAIGVRRVARGRDAAEAQRRAPPGPEPP